MNETVINRMQERSLDAFRGQLKLPKDEKRALKALFPVFKWVDRSICGVECAVLSGLRLRLHLRRLENLKIPF
ncbi:hypothetical protein [Hufsiella ginkgonis]|uniref:Uncharacterized protein n=1 Tax=Hufsiella ginkgonis TaxID=2695274 RepID=A0A7K1XS26_9SPHI|nr:hypothetical protein [Hufsiella ginkgonis]MXV13750.1 hypothetical protein [Hufsiella ginkgonis]